MRFQSQMAFGLCLASLSVFSLAASAQLGKPKAAAKKSKLASIRVRLSGEVQGNTFTLGEVAEIQSREARLKAKLLGLNLGTSPLPGCTRLLNRGDIIVKLRGAGIDETTLEIEAPLQFQVARARNEVSSERVIAEAAAVARAKTRDYPEASLIPDPLPSLFILPSGKISLETGTLRGTVENGTLNVPVLLKADGKTVQTVDVTLRVKRKMRVLIANRTLEPNDILGADDVSLAVVELPNGFVRPMTATREAVGKKVKRRVLADAPISGANVESPPLIAANDRVTLEYAVGLVSVTVTGVARQAGLAGDLIRIYLPDTKKEVEAFVVSRGTVRLPESAE